MAQNGFDIRLLGDRELDRAFAKLEKKDARRMLKRTFSAVAKKIKADVQSLVPVDLGALKQSITIKTRKVKKGIGVQVMAPPREDLAVAIAAAPERGSYGKRDAQGRILKGETSAANAAKAQRVKAEHYYYPAVVEYGAPGRAARPYLRPAFDRNEQSALSDIKSALRKEMEL